MALLEVLSGERFLDMVEYVRSLVESLLRSFYFLREVCHREPQRKDRNEMRFRRVADIGAEPVRGEVVQRLPRLMLNLFSHMFIARLAVRGDVVQRK